MMDFFFFLNQEWVHSFMFVALALKPSSWNRFMCKMELSQEKYDAAGRSVSIKKEKALVAGTLFLTSHTSTAWCCHQFPAGWYVRKHFWEDTRNKRGRWY